MGNAYCIPSNFKLRLFREAHWRTVLTTKDKAKALAWAREIGDKVRIEEITPRPKRR
ncbi:hypothetical protein [Mesorhizobium sp. P5_C1]